MLMPLQSDCVWRLIGRCLQEYSRHQDSKLHSIVQLQMWCQKLKPISFFFKQTDRLRRLFEGHGPRWRRNCSALAEDTPHASVMQDD